jgi:hypothetical protein
VHRRRHGRRGHLRELAELAIGAQVSGISRQLSGAGCSGTRSHYRRGAAVGVGAQPIGEAAVVADDVYQLKVPVPIPLKFLGDRAERTENETVLFRAA